MRALAARLNMAAAILAVISDNIPTMVTGQKNVRNNSCTLRSITAGATTIINQDCDFCIQSAQCSWCADPNWSGPRCDQRAWFKEHCPPEFIQDPDNQIEIPTGWDLPLTTGEIIEGQRFVQISPQKVRLKLRPNRTSKFTFGVIQAKQYPVDLYYLMDLSNSMSDDKDTIVRLSQEIVSAVSNITKDFQIGFGSFVDKEVMPFISLAPNDNCQTENCPPPYSFQHQMKLARDSNLFTERVSKANISGNIDNPEGGFDALLQVMVCEEDIGWRDQSRKVIIYTTDQSFHIAMDGKLGGIVTPNDGKCHLNPSGYYSYSKIQDYPSIGHINHIAKNKSVNIIWAVTEDKIGLYRTLSNHVFGSSSGTLSFDSSNIVDLVREQYEMITTVINVTVSKITENCHVKINPICQSKSGNACLNVELGNPVEFEMEVTLKSCKEEIIKVKPVGMNEELIIEVEPLCTCPCSTQDVVQDDASAVPSKDCNNNGHSICGTCDCIPPAYGPQCECDNGSIEELLDPFFKCRPKLINAGNETDEASVGKVCNDRGECHCGKCVCDKTDEVTFTGDFCETICYNTGHVGCPRDKYGQICSGNGVCNCSKCECEKSWHGVACECPIDETEKCRKTPDSPICSNRGECPCDRCLCEEGYGGKYCDFCITCTDQCEQLRPCVECVAFNSPERLIDPKNSKELNDIIRANCSQFCPYYPYNPEGPFKFDELTFTEITNSTDWNEDWNNCTLLIGPCRYTFSHSIFFKDEGPEQVILHLDPDTNLPIEDRRKKCAKPPPLLGILLGIIGAIVGVGLVTIFLWKAFTTIHDKREFARFEQERLSMKWNTNSNPIFKQATTTIQNPTFNPHEY